MMNQNTFHVSDLNHPQTPFQDISEVIHVFELAFRLEKAFHEKLIDESCFTKQIIVNSIQGFGFSEKSFNHDTIAARLHNIVLSTIAALAIAVDKGLDTKFGDKKFNENDSINSLRAFFYMLRCGCSHDVVNPKWRVNPNYQMIYTIVVPKQLLQRIFPNEDMEHEFIFDFKKLNGNDVEFDDFGRLKGLMALALYAANLTE